MVESNSQKDIQITLQVMNIKVPVTEQLPVMVIWSRGSKKASTKKRLLSDSVHTAVFNEKFQINTQIDMDADGKPIKAKNVSAKHLLVANC